MEPKTTAPGDQPGWFDKKLRWRRAAREHYRRTIIVAPSEGFVAGLPGGKLPDRTDFYTFRYPQRRRRWDAAVSAGQDLADALSDVHEKQQWGAVAEPLPW